MYNLTVVKKIINGPNSNYNVHLAPVGIYPGVYHERST